MSTTATPPLLSPSPSPTRRPPRLPAGWLRSTITGVEAAALGWLAVVVPAVAAYVATASAPVLGAASWMDAARTGTSLWLLAQGGSMQLGGGATVSLAPLGLTLISVALVYGGARRARLRGWLPAAFTVAGYVLTAVLVSAVVPGPAGRPGLLAGAAAVGLLGTAAALARGRSRPPGWARRAVAAVPGSVRAGAGGAARALLGVAGLAVVLTAMALATAVEEIAVLHRALGPDTFGSVILVLAQLAWLPTVVVWSLAWLAGPGFAVGTGTHFAATEVVTAPLPAVPMLGALPAPGAPGLGWVVLAPVLVGAVVGWWLHRRRFAPHAGHAVASAAVAGAGAGVLAGVLAAVARGSIGPGRMAEVGAAPLAVAGAVAAAVGLGAVVVVLAAHPWTRATIARGYRAARERLRRRDDAAGADDATAAGA